MRQPISFNLVTESAPAIWMFPTGWEWYDWNGCVEIASELPCP